METSETADLALNLGCGNQPIPNAINHDIVKHGDFVDMAHDLEVTPWPWDDNMFKSIFAIDLIEHLHDFIGFFNEAWRILKPDGEIIIRTPLWDSLNAVIDPTHVRCYHPESFDYLDPTTLWGSKYSMYTTRKWHKMNFIIDGCNILVIMKVVKQL